MTEEEKTKSKQVGGFWQNDRNRRLTIAAGALLLAFLIGFLPMWSNARESRRERDAAQRELRVGSLQNTLGTAVVEAVRGEYEPARQSASMFFSTLREELEKGDDSAFDKSRQEKVRAIMLSRDDLITLLARGDSASRERLAEIYLNYRDAVGGTPSPIPNQQNN